MGDYNITYACREQSSQSSYFPKDKSDSSKLSGREVSERDFFRALKNIKLTPEEQAKVDAACESLGRGRHIPDDRWNRHITIQD